VSADGKFSDLTTRLISAAVLMAIAAVALWAGGIVFTLLIAICAGLMAWEMLRIHGASSVVGWLCALSVGMVTYMNALAWSDIGLVALILLTVPCAVAARRSRILVAVYIALIVFACVSLAYMRQPSILPPLFVIACVIASDVGGYFAGRVIGGPKFWPAVSPKKTWSGTIGGWVLAALVAVIFVMSGAFQTGAIGFAVVLAMAAQAGDLSASWIKRRVGVKDYSNLIPGHGGLLDRFDGLIGASILAGVITLV